LPALQIFFEYHIMHIPTLFPRFMGVLTSVILSLHGIAFSAPVLNTINPATGPTNGGTSIMLTGQNFGATPSVTIGGLAATVQLGGTGTSIVVTSPAGEGANLNVIVTDAGSPSNALQFSYLPPQITTVSPTVGPSQGGITITLTGTNFGLNPFVVIGGNIAAPILSSSHVQITCILPAGQGGNREVRVIAGGQTSAAAYFSYDPPVITTISQASGPTVGGTAISIFGSNFGNAPVVTFNGVVVASTADPVFPTGKLYITSPAGFGAGRKIIVTASGQASNGVDFDYYPPAPTTISPANGPTLGGVPITVTGSNFGANPTITIGGVATAILAGSTDGSLVFTLPVGKGANLDVKVVGQDGRASYALPFSYNPPLISSVSPTTAPSEGGAIITVNGSNFGPSPSITIGGNAATVLTASHGQITCVLPAGQGSNREVRVAAGNQTSAAATFSYAPPFISGLSPSSGSTLGGTTITLFGTNLGNAATATFNGVSVPCTHDATYPHNIVTIVSPPGSGIGKKIILNAAGQLSNSVDFNYSPPTLSGISPANGPTAGGAPIILSGANFGANPTVTVGGVNATVLAGSTESSLTFTLPVGEGLNQSVQVSSGSASSTNTLLFNYNAPAISGVSPATGTTAGGTTITLTGSSFGLNPSVFIGPSFAPILSNSHGQITCTLPAGQGSNREVRVIVAGQTSLPAYFSYTAPAIISISPANGPTVGGTTITLTGSNFGTAPVVTFGGVVIPNTRDVSTPHSRLTITTPSGYGTGKSIVVLAGDQLSNSLDFNYDAPLLTGISPATGPITGNIPITLTGANFGTSSFVSIGGKNAPLLAGSTVGHLVVNLPAGQGLAEVVITAPDGRQSGSQNYFTYDGPSITSISAASKPTSGNVPVTITGSNFGASSTVTLGGNSVPVVSFSSTQIVFTLPESFLGATNLPVVVRTGTQASGVVNLSYDLPQITSISPATGPTVGGNSITLTGTSFGYFPTVYIGGVAVATLWTGTVHTQVVAMVPVGMGRNLTVEVRTAVGSSNLRLYSYQPPLITSISPATGLIAGGTVITLHGANFGTSQTVSIGGKIATPVAGNMDGILQVILPPGHGAGLPLTVTTAGQVSNTMSFSYEPGTFDIWKNSIAWGGLSNAPAADPRGTGWTNLLSYALGVNPLTTNGGETASYVPQVFGKPAMTRDAQGHLQIGYWFRRAGYADDLTYQVQFSSSLTDAAWEPATNPQTVQVLNEEWEYRVATDQAALGARRFARLRVTTTAP
jgi:large repetitive protein